MKTLVLAIAMALGCHLTTSATPDAETLTSCEADFDSVIVKTCNVAADCVLLSHVNCCGAVDLGIAASDQSAASSAEARYDNCAQEVCGARGCASQTTAEDGQVPMQNQAIVPTCVAGQCSSTVQ